MDEIPVDIGKPPNSKWETSLVGVLGKIVIYEGQGPANKIGKLKFSPDVIAGPDADPKIGWATYGVIGIDYERGIEGDFISSIDLEIEVSHINRLAVQMIVDAILASEFKAHIRSIDSVDWSYSIENNVRTARMGLSITPEASP